jgi:hypothetical protein
MQRLRQVPSGRVSASGSDEFGQVLAVEIPRAYMQNAIGRTSPRHRAAARQPDVKW